MTVNEAPLGGDKAADGRDGNPQLIFLLYWWYCHAILLNMLVS